MVAKQAMYNIMCADDESACLISPFRTSVMTTKTGAQRPQTRAQTQPHGQPTPTQLGVPTPPGGT